jgi:preprotein translocase SecE subunit
MAVELAKIPQKTRNFIIEVNDEMKKVTWPDWPQLKNATLVIIVFIFAVSLIIFTMDKIVNLIVGPSGLFLNLFGR